jgi:hypothetical protein
MMQDLEMLMSENIALRNDITALKGNSDIIEGIMRKSNYGDLIQQYADTEGFTKKSSNRVGICEKMGNCLKSWWVNQ